LDLGVGPRFGPFILRGRGRETARRKGKERGKGGQGKAKVAP